MNSKHRAYANALAARLAKRLKKAAPKCTRITRRRGHAYYWRGEFSVPVWAITAHPAYALYYVLHEACHCFARTSGHGPDFLHLEAELLESEGLRIIRRENSKNGYAEALLDLHTGELLCDKHGQPVIDFQI
jgi:hypothetical protein